MIRSTFFAAAVLCLFATALQADEAGAGSWVEKSNENAAVLLDVMARFNPEQAAQLGVDGYDEQIIDLMPNLDKRSNAATEEALKTLTAQKEGEQNRAVAQDLEILIKAAKDGIRGTNLYRSYQLPYFNVPSIVFAGVRALLDDQIPAERRGSALVRLRKYAGHEEGTTAIATLAMQRTTERLGEAGLKGPVKAEVEKDLNDAGFYIDGIGALFQKYELSGYEAAYETLKGQLTEYMEFVKNEVLPRSTDDFRLPTDLYAFNLEQYGVTMKPEELASRARHAFEEIRNEMQKVAGEVAAAKGWSETDYHDVIRALKADQVVGDAILPLYQKRAADMEEIIAREHLVTLPTRPMSIRLASEAESAAIPAPHMRPPRLIGNTGEVGEFVLPLRVPGKTDEEGGKLDDFTYEAVSWTLTAHEGRPGHEMQFSSMIEKGVSTARMIFAFNSVNVEGWGLYSEAIVYPYLPPEGQLGSLQARLLRAARAFLDPELQMGTLTREEAFNLLRDEVVLSEAMATQEVDRYTFRAPGQATSYFFGFLELMNLRRDVETMLDAQFDQQQFHDYILSQGLLPPDLMREAVMDHFVAGKKM